VSGRRILIVDDDPASCEVVAYFLKSLGYRVATAADGTRALNMDLEDDVELVILDAHMPVHDGVEVLEMLRDRPLVTSIKFIALTADESPRLREEFEGAGIDGFLTKPVDLVALRAEVTRLLPGGSQNDSHLIRMMRAQGLDQIFDGTAIDPRANLERN
jgi:CheY-like chemotaxis protein